MCPKFGYKHQKRPSPAPESGQIYCCATLLKPFWPNMHPDKLICQFVLNLKMSVTKASGVSFETSNDYILQKSQKGVTNNRSWKPQLSPKLHDYFPSVFIFKACVSYYFYVSPKQSP